MKHADYAMKCNVINAKDVMKCNVTYTNGMQHKDSIGSQKRETGMIQVIRTTYLCGLL